MRQLHDRQPVILDPEYYDAWLSSETTAPEASQILKHHLDGQLQFHRVGRDVNSSKFKGDTAINPLWTAPEGCPPVFDIDSPGHENIIGTFGPP